MCCAATDNAAKVNAKSKMYFLIVFIQITLLILYEINIPFATRTIRNHSSTLICIIITLTTQIMIISSTINTAFQFTINVFKVYITMSTSY